MCRRHRRRSAAPHRAWRRRARREGYACGTKTSLLARDFGRQSAGARNPCNRASSNHSGAHPPRSAGESASCPSDTSPHRCARRSGTASAVHGSAWVPSSPVSPHPHHAAPNTFEYAYPESAVKTRVRGPTTPLPPPGGTPASPDHRNVEYHPTLIVHRRVVLVAFTPPERSCAPDERQGPLLTGPSPPPFFPPASSESFSRTTSSARRSARLSQLTSARIKEAST